MQNNDDDSAEQETGHCVQNHDDWLGSETQDYLSEKGDLNKQWESAKFLLHVTEEHKLTHNGVDNLCDSIQWLCR